MPATAAAKPRFSRTVSAPLMALLCPIRCSRARCPARSSNAGLPSHHSVPVAGARNPANSRSRLDLPAPLGPCSSRVSPGDSANVTSASTRRPPRSQARSSAANRNDSSVRAPVVDHLAVVGELAGRSQRIAAQSVIDVRSRAIASTSPWSRLDLAEGSCGRHDRGARPRGASCRPPDDAVRSPDLARVDEHALDLGGLVRPSQPRRRRLVRPHGLCPAKAPTGRRSRSGSGDSRD